MRVEESVVFVFALAMAYIYHSFARPFKLFALFFILYLLTKIWDCKRVRNNNAPREGDARHRAHVSVKEGEGALVACCGRLGRCCGMGHRPERESEREGAGWATGKEERGGFSWALGPEQR